MEFRSYSIVDGQVTEEEVAVVPSLTRSESSTWPSRIRSPTILRTYTGAGRRPSPPTAPRPEHAHRLARRRPPQDQGAPDREQPTSAPFTGVYVNDEDVRFIGGLEAELGDGDQVVVLPAVAGGGLDTPSPSGSGYSTNERPRGTLRKPPRLGRQHAARGVAGASRPTPEVRLWAKLEEPDPSGWIEDGPALADGRRGGGEGRRPTKFWLHDPQAHLRQHHGVSRIAMAAPRTVFFLRLCDAPRTPERGAAPDPPDVGRRDRRKAPPPAAPTRRSASPRRCLSRAPRLGDALPVRRRRQRARARRGHRTPSCWPTSRRSRISSPGSAPPAPSWASPRFFRKAKPGR